MQQSPTPISYLPVISRNTIEEEGQIPKGEQNIELYPKK
jgi:hypothetical protein